MSDNKQDVIIGYFIEEAREHLSTLEQGLLNLADVIDDTEEVNELFRAAHSIKGGAGMLSFSSIQKTAHRLEDAFKFLQENDVEVDSKLESLFLNGFDTLQDLIVLLESPGGYEAERADKIAKAAEPRFVELQQYLESMQGEEPVSGSSAAAIAAQIRGLLKDMLQQFREDDNPGNRQRLQELCNELGQVGADFETWKALVEVAKSAISNPRHSYSTLAPIAIKELKRGSDAIELGKAAEITPNESLQRLAKSSAPHVLMPVEPKAAAKTLMRIFNQQQLSQLVQLLEAGR